MEPRQEALGDARAVEAFRQMLLERLVGARAEAGIIELGARSADDPEPVGQQAVGIEAVKRGSSMRRARSPVAPNITRVEIRSAIRGAILQMSRRIIDAVQARPIITASATTLVAMAPTAGRPRRPA